MEHTRFNAEFCAKTVLGFCRFPVTSLGALAADLSLTLSEAGLLHCQQYFRDEARRDPTVGELKFIAALAVRMNELPAALALEGLHFCDEASARVFADVMRQRKALGKSGAPSPTDLLCTVTEYLARSSRTVAKRERALQVGEAAYIAARADTSVLRLSLGNAGAALLPPFVGHTRKSGDVILALSATAGATPADAIADFFAGFSCFSPTPLALIGAEGLGVHLGALPMGAELDLMPLADFDAASGAPALLNACKDTLLLSCPQEAALAMLRAGAPLALIGRLRADNLVSVRYGIQPLLTISAKFLATFRATRIVQATIPAREVKSFTGEIKLAENENSLLCGGVLDEAPEAALCHLLTTAHAEGAAMMDAVLGAVLSLPLGADEDALGIALSLMLPLHRFAAEMALGTGAIRILTTEANTKPSLSVFLTAPKCPDKRDADALKTALFKGDFATARQIIYGGAAEK